MSVVDDDIVSNASNNAHLREVIEARLSRRDLLGGLSALGGMSALLAAVPAQAGQDCSEGPLLGFSGVPVSTDDVVHVAAGYSARVLIAWGDPVCPGAPSFAPDASNTAEEQAQQWGMHNDGMVFFPIRRSSNHGLLVQNHEYTDDGLLFPDGTANWTAEKTRKSLAAHGVSVIEVKQTRRHRGQAWKVVDNSPYARRITGMTPIAMGGPLAQRDQPTADSRLITSEDPTGRKVLGTLNNCAMGYTPWGTYLTCEENFNGYFRKTGARTALETRYGIDAAGFGYLWHTTDKRFDVDAEPNEPNRFGYVVEFDPFAPASVPVKRSALGRIKHEGAWVQEARDGRVVVYMGDDERNEYIYRFVSKLPWRKAVRRGVSPLDEGVLYVARFNADGSGAWLPLSPENPALAGWTLNDILINTRGAADAAGATKMDRPEWIDTFPNDLVAMVTLTNNSRRGTSSAPVDAANPRGPNPYGHILRWYYQTDWTDLEFGWDIFAMAGDPANPAHGSTIVGDKYGSPDGLYVAPSGRLWIQTDVSTSTIDAGDYAGFGNNQMLCADPYSGETRRFLTGPKQCEITGVFVTPDERTMFVGIQHPGEAPSGNNDPGNPARYSTWPDGAPGARPRSATIVITKDDGGPIGS